MRSIFSVSKQKSEKKKRKTKEIKQEKKRGNFDWKKNKKEEKKRSIIKNKYVYFSLCFFFMKGCINVIKHS